MEGTKLYPAADIENTFNSYSAFETFHDMENYESNLTNASKIVSATRKICQKFQQYEDELQSTSYHTPVLDDYLEFLRNYKADTSAIFALYERAVKKYYFEEYYWSSYIVDMVKVHDNFVIM